MGCVIQASQGQNVARQASIKAGIPNEVPAFTLNVVCGSGLKCVNEAANMIMAGQADIVVAGGCLLYTSPSPRDGLLSRMPSSA